MTTLLLPLLGAGTVTSPGLVPLMASIGALGLGVLVVYESALLYNLAHMPGWLPLIELADGVLALARWWALRPVTHGPAVSSLVASFGWFLVPRFQCCMG